MTRLVTRADILPAADYARMRKEKRAEIVALKKNRRLEVGPFATFLTFDTLDEAIRIANDSKFGLVNYVWSDDLPTVMRCSREIRAGTVWVNTPLMRELRAPFGGVKESGIGRDGPQTSLDFFTELKSTIIPIDPVKMHRYGA